MRKDLTIAGMVAVGVLLLYGLTLGPTISFGDGPELTAAAACLGVAHPPGYPLYTWLGWLAIRWSPGSPALTMNLLSALFGALACGGLAWLLLRWTRSPAAAVAGATGFAASSTFWLVAVTTEVYTLHLALIAGLLGAGSLAGDDRRRTGALLFGCLMLGLGLAHHPTIVLALPAALWLGWKPQAWRSWSIRRGAAWAGGLALVASPPLLFYGTLMLRARADPPSNWGHVVDPASLVAHAAALTYRHLDLGWSGLLRAAPWKHLGSLILGEFGLPFLLLSLAGLLGWPGWKSVRIPWKLRVATLLLVLPTAAFGLRYDVEDVAVFYLPAFFGLALAAGLALAPLLRDSRRGVSRAGLVAALLAVLLTAWGNGASRNLGATTAAEDYARDVLDTIPPDGLLFVLGSESFGVLYLTQVLGERPDVTVYHREGVLFRDLREEIGVAPLEGESSRGYSIRVEQAFIDRELRGPSPRPVMFLGWPGYDTPPRYRIEPVGLLHRVRAATDPPEDVRALWAGYAERSVTAQAQRMNEPLALAFAATYPMARGERAYFEGNREGAVAFFDEAVRVSGEEASILSYIGTVYGRHGDLDRAIGALRRAVEIRPASFWGWNNLGLAYERNGQPAEARAAWERALSLAPGHDDVLASLRRLDAAPN